MNILAIETASEACSVALSTGGEILEKFSLAPRGHAELVLPWAQELLADAGIGLNDLDAIAYSRGPGSFTSLRIGVGVVQGLAWGAGLPVVPVSSLQSLAQSLGGECMGPVIVAMDARMQEVYSGRFRPDASGVMSPEGEETVGAPEALVALPTEGWSGAGSGFARFEVLGEFGRGLVSVHPEAWPRAAAMVTLAGHWLQDNEGLPADRAQLVYLRDKVAEKSSTRP